MARFLYFVYPKNILKLKTLRQNLAEEILSFVNAHIKEADPKYEKERILFKKENARGDTEKQVMISRNAMRKSSGVIDRELSQIFISN